MRPWASRVARSSSSSTHSPTFRGSGVGTRTCTRCWTTRTGPWLGAWLACQPLFRHVAEHHFGTRPRGGTGTLFPHQPHSTDWSGRRWVVGEPDVLNGSLCTSRTPSAHSVASSQRYVGPQVQEVCGTWTGNVCPMRGPRGSCLLYTSDAA